MALHLIERIAVDDDEGDGEPVVCVHGLGGTSNTWTPVLAGLARRRVVRIDLPGSGRSQRAEGSLSIERFADAVLSVCNRLGLAGKLALLGHSMGTIVCQHVAASEPSKVDKVALFGPLIAPPEPARAAMRQRAAKAREGAAAMQEITEALLKSALSAESRERNPLAVAFVRESLLRQEGEAYARSCEALADTRPAAVEKITASVLLVTGDEDAVAPPASVRAMADKLHGTRAARVVVLPRCGHWTPVERPTECVRELADFLSGR